MGLCLHFVLQAPGRTDASGAEALVTALHERAEAMLGRGALERVGPVDGDPNLVGRMLEWLQWSAPETPAGAAFAGVRPEVGILFPVSIGTGCDSMTLGLCHYPRYVEVEGVRRPTRLVGWRLAASVKTQYASNHGWDHFRRCHLAALDLLCAAREVGFRVRIMDDGGYWPRRSEGNLRRNLERLNRLVAAVTGAVKDAAGAAALGTQSPILAHPRFEQLEAEGQAELLPAIRGFIERLRDPDADS